MPPSRSVTLKAKSKRCLPCSIQKPSTPRNRPTPGTICSGRAEDGYFGPGNAQLPAPPMLMMDRITQISLDGGELRQGSGRGRARYPAPELWFFGCHFPGDPADARMPWA